MRKTAIRIAAALGLGVFATGGVLAAHPRRSAQCARSFQAFERAVAASRACVADVDCTLVRPEIEGGEPCYSVEKSWTENRDALALARAAGTACGFETVFLWKGSCEAARCVKGRCEVVPPPSGPRAEFMKAIGGLIASRKMEIRDCSSKARWHGTMVLHAAIAPSGELRSLVVQDGGVAPKAVQACGMALLRKWHWPGGGGEVNIPFTSLE